MLQNCIIGENRLWLFLGWAESNWNVGFVREAPEARPINV
jgi:hypothetical protein